MAAAPRPLNQTKVESRQQLPRPLLKRVPRVRMTPAAMLRVMMTAPKMVPQPVAPVLRVQRAPMDPAASVVVVVVVAAVAKVPALLALQSLRVA